MKIMEIGIDQLKAAEYNPRIELEPDSTEFKNIKNSLEAFGYVEPIVWNKRTGNVVGGHQRLAVLKHNGETKTQVSVIDIDIEEEKMLNVALNKIKGQWDYEKLEELLKSFDNEEALLTGFTSDELSLIFADDAGIIFDTVPLEDVQKDDEGLSDGSWVITLKFDTPGKAEDWIRNHGLDKEIKEGSHTTIIRIEE